MNTHSLALQNKKASHTMRGFFFVLYALVLISSSVARAEFYQEQIHPIVENVSDSTSLWLWAGGAAAVLLARTQDDWAHDNWGSHQLMNTAESKIGDILGTGVPGLLVAFGQYKWDDETKGENHLRAILAAGATTYVLKYSFGRQRPNSNDHLSFPSGHTSTTFASATSLAYAYGAPVAIPAYALAVFTGLSRVSDNAHWLSDVVGGAFIGVIFGRASYFQSKSTSTFFVPYIESDTYGLEASYSF